MKQYMTFPKKSFREKFIGDKAFYKMILTIAIPIMVQNGISNFVSMLDNIMVGRVGTEAMSGVSIANQLIFVYFLCMFGGLGGVGIFSVRMWQPSASVTSAVISPSQRSVAGPISTRSRSGTGCGSVMKRNVISSG